MRNKIHVFAFIVVSIIILLPQLSSADENFIGSYDHQVRMEYKDSFHRISAIIYTTQENLVFNLPPRIKGLKALIDDEEMTCSVEEKEGASEITCPLKKTASGQHIFSAMFSTTYPIFNIDRKILYRSEYIPPMKTKDFRYSITIPKGYHIQTGKDPDFFINPSPKTIYSDGNSIVLLWDIEDLETNFEVSVVADPDSHIRSFFTASNIAIIIVMLLLSAMAYLISNQYKKRLAEKKKKNSMATEETMHSALLENEKIVLSLLAQAKERTLWQKEIQLKTGFSKVKVSRIIRDLEQRSVVVKEPWGNTNKIRLMAANKERDTRFKGMGI